nr:MAG TPA: hypothetical protein [Caudoviricetes sp.]
MSSISLIVSLYCFANCGKTLSSSQLSIFFAIIFASPFNCSNLSPLRAKVIIFAILLILLKKPCV